MIMSPARPSVVPAPRLRPAASALRHRLLSSVLVLCTLSGLDARAQQPAAERLEPVTDQGSDARAQQAELPDFKSWVELARNNDPALRSARKETEAMGFGVDEARAGLLPTVLFSASQTSTNQEVLSSQNAVFEKGKAPYPGTVYGLTITQPLLRLSAWRRLEYARLGAEQAQWTLAAAEQDLIVRTSSAYLAVLAARDAVELAHSEERAIAALLELMQQKFASKLIAAPALNEVVGRHEIKRAEVLAAETELADRMSALQEIVGPVALQVLQALPPLRQQVSVPDPDPASEQAWREAARTQNPLIRARELAVQAQEAEVRRIRAAYAPSLDLVLGTNQKKTEGSLFGGGSEVSTTEFAFNLNYPLYEGGITRAQLRQALIRHDAALDELERVRRQIERQSGTTYRAVIAGKARVVAFEQSVTAYASVRELRQASVEAGILGVVPLLDAERDLFRARRDLAQARYDLLVNALKLRQLSGSLDETDVDALSAMMY